MEVTIKEIQESMELGTATPEQLAQYRVVLSGVYARMSDQLANLEADKAKKWLIMRKDYKSDKATDRAWDATDDGQLEIHLRSKMRKIDKMSTSIASLLYVKGREAKNQM